MGSISGIGWQRAAIAVSICLFVLPPVRAVDRVVSTTAGFSAALANAQPGDSILLMPGNYGGGHFRAGLNQVTIRSQDAENPAIIQGGVNGIQLSDASNVVIEDLVFEAQTGNGINIDDGGSFDTPATDITLRNMTVRDMNALGNNDGIKLSGVTGFLIDRVVVENWGDGGSAVDPVGSHNGLIQNSIFRHDDAGSSGVRPKGGSKNLRILANRFEMPGGTGRAIQAGGSTGTEFFRFIDGDSGYEADNVTAAGNLIIDAHAAVSYANIDGGNFHHNWLQNPRNWAMRILNENQGRPIVDTQNGVFTDNVIEYDGNQWNRPANVGPETLPETFTFARNQWNNATGTTSVSLPAPEIDGQYGSIDVQRSGDGILWELDWGYWLVNATQLGPASRLTLDGFQNLLLAQPASTGEFDPTAADPLSGEWTFEPLLAPTIAMQPQQNLVAIRPDASAAVSNVPGDYDRSGKVDTADYDLWRAQFGASGPALADGNGDGVVNLGDYTIWRDRLGATAVSGANMSVVPELSGLELLVPLIVTLGFRYYAGCVSRRPRFGRLLQNDQRVLSNSAEQLRRRRFHGKKRL